ncbi:MAG: HTH domain-containing protein [Pirellulales bacterium]|nr:HTH domain-containing protein [Pirellulales bacterium]
MKLELPKARRNPSQEAIIRQRIARTIRMLGLLKSGPIYNSQRLADELSVSRRTVYRDLKSLREAGVAVLIDARSESYYVRAQREPGQIPMAHDDQVVLLALAAHLSPLNCSREFSTKIRSAIAEMIAGLPHGRQLEVGRLLTSVRAEAHRLPSQMMDEIVCALRRQQPIRVLAEAQRGAYVNLEIVPCQLIASANGWQLSGHTAGNRQLQSFQVSSFLRVERIESRQGSSPVDGLVDSESRCGTGETIPSQAEPTPDVNIVTHELARKQARQKHHRIDQNFCPSLRSAG